MELQGVHVFSDGAARGNPGPAGWAAIVAVVADKATVLELGGSLGRGTNNQAELEGAIQGLRAAAAHPGPATLYSDSQYVLRGASAWIAGWKRNGWRTRSGGPVANAERWRELDALVIARKASGSLRFRYLPGHAGIPANERADRIACGFADGRPPALYRGELIGYDVPVFDVPDTPEDLPKRRAASSASRASSGTAGKAKPVCYLSLVAGVLERHASWAECEARVRGQRGARFRKAMSAEDERSIRSAWGV